MYLKIFPGLSVVPANNEPIITASAPAAIAFEISPENFIPPSEIILVLKFFSAFLTSKTALSCGTPMPVTSLVVQIEPGPIPTLTISTPASAKNFAALPVAIFPAQIIEFFEIFFILFIIVKTFWNDVYNILMTHPYRNFFCCKKFFGDRAF